MLEIKNVTKVFNMTGDKEDAKRALDNLNLVINDGEFVTIIGSNGSCKTTTLNIITGEKKPDTGKVLLSGMDITKLKVHERAKYFGRVFQDPMIGTSAEMSCLENMELSFRRGKHRSMLKWGFSDNTVKLLFKKQLSEFGLGLENRLNQKVGVMSGGQRQALTLLMASTDCRIDTEKEFYTMHADVETGQLKVAAEKEINDALEQIKSIKNSIKDARSASNETIVSELKGKEVALRVELKELIQKHKNIIKENYDHYKQEAIEFYRKAVETYKLHVVDASDEMKVEEYLALSKKLHDFNQDRQILLLDEHTAALDPKTAKKVLELTDKIVREKHLTTLMITHNMKDALTYGDRLIMFHEGHIILDVCGDEKKKLKIQDLLDKFALL